MKLKVQKDRSISACMEEIRRLSFPSNVKQGMYIMDGYTVIPFKSIEDDFFSNGIGKVQAQVMSKGNSNLPPGWTSDDTDNWPNN